MNKPLITTNPHLRDPQVLRAAIKQTTVSSMAVEGYIVELNDDTQALFQKYCPKLATKLPPK